MIHGARDFLRLNFLPGRAVDLFHSTASLPGHQDINIVKLCATCPGAAKDRECEAVVGMSVVASSSSGSIKC